MPTCTHIGDARRPGRAPAALGALVSAIVALAPSTATLASPAAPAALASPASPAALTSPASPAAAAEPGDDPRRIDDPLGLERALPGPAPALAPGALSADAGLPTRARRPAPSRAAASVEIPLDVAAGPAAHLLFGPVFRDQALHTGLKLSVAAVLDAAFLKRHRGRIPARFRRFADATTEVRVGPSIFIPDTLVISPRWRNTELYGVTWRPISLGLAPVTEPVRVFASAGLLATYLYVHSDTLERHTTHFLRPGAALGLDVEVPLAERFLVSVGWDSQLYPPQRLGERPWELAATRESIWHVGQAYVLFHYRFPYALSP